MTGNGSGGNIGGIGLGGILVIVGVVVAFAWSTWLGIVIALIGLIAFGGFARGRWSLERDAWPGKLRRRPPASSAQWLVRSGLARWLEAEAAAIAARGERVRVLDIGCGVAGTTRSSPLWRPPM